MKKIIISLAVIGVVSAVVIGGTIAYFSDTETSSNNIIQTGTVDIEIDGQNPWTGTFNWENVKPGEDKEITFVIENVGTYPIKLWKIIKNLTTEENGIIEPEQDWYDTNNGGQSKNDIDTAMVYEMYVDNNLVVEKEAGITLDEIKDYYMNLVKLDQATDPNYQGPDPNGSGILNPGGSITVVQRYYFKEDTSNWAQSDKITFDIEILAQQVDAPEPIKQLSFMNNKLVSGDWSAVADNRIGLLKYDSMASMFNYDFMGIGLNPTTEYCLIYSKDPWTGGAKILINKGISGVNGDVSLAGSMDIGDLPYTDDGNYPIGAKIWSLPCSSYSESNQSVGWPPTDNWLFDNWPGFIRYTKGEVAGGSTTTVQSKSIYLSDLGADPQYGYTHDYSNATVGFTYDTPQNGKLNGIISGSGLKPYATYQIKIIGKPTCEYGLLGDDGINENIGYKGRWTVLNFPCTGAGCNRTDAQYEANKLSGTECIAGYLVFDYFTADSNGDIYASDVNITSDTSCHVLRCGGGVCGSISDIDLGYLDSSHPGVSFCPYDKVNGEPEPGRGGCGGLTLSPGNYDTEIVITEESFHQGPGTWTTVMSGDIIFEVE